MTDLAALIARLEAAERGSRALDIDIYYDALGNPDEVGFCKHCGSHRFVVMPEFTSSIEAALMLVPRDSMWDVESRGMAYVGPANAPSRQFHRGATPALALCIAALKQRVHEHPAGPA